jgi:hypothetical protein
MEKNSYTFNDALKGVLLMVAGVLLLLYTFGIIEWGINLVVMIIAIIMIIFGTFKSGLVNTIITSWERLRKRKE